MFQLFRRGIGNRTNPPPAPQRDQLDEQAATRPVEFIGYTARCVFVGSYVLAADRLTDAMNRQTSVALTQVQLQVLDPLEFKELDQVTIPRDELLLVHATGPRGDPARRFRAWPHAVIVRIGPYQVEGLIHSVPGAHPTLGIYHRQHMVVSNSCIVPASLMNEFLKFRMIRKHFWGDLPPNLS